MTIWKKASDIKSLNDAYLNNVHSFMGLEFVDVGDDYLSMRMLVDNKAKNPFDTLHGGVSCLPIESVGNSAADRCVDVDKYCVALDLNINHIRPVKSGYIIATARPIHIGSTTQVWGVTILDENHKLVATSRMTMAVLNKQ